MKTIHSPSSSPARITFGTHFVVFQVAPRFSKTDDGRTLLVSRFVCCAKIAFFLFLFGLRVYKVVEERLSWISAMVRPPILSQALPLKTGRVLSTQSHTVQVLWNIFSAVSLFCSFLFVHLELEFLSHSGEIRWE